MKHYITIALTFMAVCFGSFSVKAQQDSQFTQYMYNMVSFNPAYAGNRGSLTVLGTYRNQWVGLDGAPETLNFSLNTPIGLDGVGVGLGFTSDHIGPSSKNIITGDFSYTITVDRRETQLSFGLKAGISTLDIDFNKLQIYNPNDLNNVNRSIKSPVVGIGFYLHNENWYAGISTPNMLETKHYDDIAVSTATEKIHVYLTGGYVFDLSTELKFKPTVLAKAVSGAPLAVDVSANFLLYEKLTLGAAYRWDAAVSGLAGFQVSNQLMVGYTYDYTTTELNNYNSGSHEIFLRFELGTRLQNKVNPRFF